jgi:hypothetical protein
MCSVFSITIGKLTIAFALRKLRFLILVLLSEYFQEEVNLMDTFFTGKFSSKYDARFYRFPISNTNKPEMLTPSRLRSVD